MATDQQERQQDETLVLKTISSSGQLVRIDADEFVAFPQSGQRKASRWIPSKSLSIFVLLPVLVAGIYNFVIATPRYTSEVSFIVRENKANTGVAALIGEGGLTRSDEASYAVVTYLESRDAVKFLDSDGMLSSIFSGASIDFGSRFPSWINGSSFDEFYKHFQHYYDVEYSSTTGIVSLETQGFTPIDAQKIASRLLEGAEKLVNALGDTAKADAIRLARQNVADAQTKLALIQKEITDFRNDSRLLTPDVEMKMNSEIITGLMSELSTADAQLSQLLQGSPDNPRVKELQLRRDALRDQLDQFRARLSGSDNSLTQKMEAYSEIFLRKQIAEKVLVNAFATLGKAELDAAKKQLYIDEVVTPGVSDVSEHMRPLLNVFLTLILTFSAYWTVKTAWELAMDEG
ncbi:ABC-2 type transport system permease protein/capsular polysaccharide transport system permease protein [Rhizobium sp. RU20A]|uniref:hypothetical protein n=1 Tax=Rhizobium sp. RU20A TaxID=1907412 RepID=UPI0009550823|nr:hypothetical protein [Rhizobium sp. RU20A]SIQ59037.1 ABC-2 type transport system permease protein/capsular polysaccharide transport system permease protein [Rhizobium sp. RU20A]